jgi:hypothetical protein
MQTIIKVMSTNIVQVVISNASNCKLMGRMIIVEYSNIMWNPCVVHCLDLMVDNIGKLD